MARRGVKFVGRRENLRYDDVLSIPTVLCDLDTNQCAGGARSCMNCNVPPVPDQHRACYRGGGGAG